MSVLLVAFLLFIVGYYLYVNVINRAPAEVYVAQRGTAVAAVYGTVTINPVQTLTLFAQNSGYLHTTPDLSNNIKAQGIIVQKDQLLGTVVDDNGLRLLHDAERAFKSAQDHQKNGPPSAGPLKTAKDSLLAQKKAGGNIPQVQIDATQNTVNSLTSAVENETLALQREVELAQSALKAAQDAQARTELHAPFPGVLTGVGFNDNSYVLPNQAVYTVADAQIYITGQVNEEDVGQLKLGMKADVSLYSFPDRNFPAAVTQILPSPDASSSRYVVNLQFDSSVNLDDFRYGMTGQMNIILGRKENALIIQTRALTTNPDQILVVDDGVIEQRTIKLGLKSSEFTEVASGISEGTEVVVSDQATFRVGDRVRPVKVNDAKPRKGK